LENQEITIRRLTGAYRYPARPLLVAASNPCPCGYYPDMNRCNCTPKEVLRYQKRISGPFIDRIDFRVYVGRVNAEELQRNDKEESSATVRVRVEEAIERQKRRFKGTPFHFNADMTPDAVEHFCSLDSLLTAKMRIVYDQMGMSVRSYHKALKMARTIADLNGREMILERDLMMAVGFRLPELTEEEKGSGKEFY
jgi:magnesium chelatase family protein